MTIIISVLLVILGLVILVFSSNWLIQSSVKLSILFKLTPLFIGLVLVAFGTSAPEAGVGIIAAVRNQKFIALGNIIGSNIANIGLVLGLCAISRPLRIDRDIFKREIPIMLFAVVLLYVLSLDLLLSRIDGFIFVLAFLFFCFISYKGAKAKFDSEEINSFKLRKSLDKIKSNTLVFSILILSLVGVIIGADLMVRGGVFLAKSLGITPWIIGITVFAIGTSLPELSASLAASFKKVPSISLGNIIGSNIFNILFVLGIVTLIRPIRISASILRFELPVMAFFSFLLFIVAKTKHRISRREGIALFLGYLLFIVLLLSRQI